jgi:hypothetical protein
MVLVMATTLANLYRSLEPCRNLLASQIGVRDRKAEAEDSQ